MKTILLFILLIVGSELRAIAQDDCHTQASNCHSVQGETYKSVFEQLRVSSSAQGHTLQLSATPATQFPFHLFRSGLELALGDDYTISGAIVTLTPKGIEESSPVFEATYVEQVSKASAQTFPGQTRALRSADSNNILNRYLQRSLQKELAAYQAADGNQSSTLPSQADSAEEGTPKRSVPSAETTVETSGVPPESPTAGGGDPESLRMLSDALSRSMTLDTSRRTQRQPARHDDDNAGADGLEGIGDALTGSPYDILANGSGGLASAFKQLDGRNGQPSGGDRSAAHKKRAPESLRLLERRLAETSQN